MKREQPTSMAWVGRLLSSGSAVDRNEAKKGLSVKGGYLQNTHTNAHECMKYWSKLRKNIKETLMGLWEGKHRAF